MTHEKVSGREVRYQKQRDTLALNRRALAEEQKLIQQDLLLRPIDEARRKIADGLSNKRKEALLSVDSFLGPNRKYGSEVWLTHEPDRIYPYDEATHVTSGDVLLGLLQGDSLYSGSYMYPNSNRLGPRLKVRDALLEICPPAFKDRGMGVWLSAPRVTENADIAKTARALLKPDRWKNAKNECLTLVNYLSSLGSTGTPISDELLQNLIHTATGFMFSFLTEPIKAIQNMSQYDLKLFAERLQRAIEGSPEASSHIFAKNVPDDLGIVELHIDFASVKKRIMREAGAYPIRPSDRAPDKIAMAPEIRTEDIISVECDYPLLDWLFSQDPQACELRQRPAFKRLCFTQSLDDDISIPGTNSLELDPLNPSCVRLYDDPRETQQIWRTIAQSGFMAPAVYSDLHKDETRDFFSNTFGIPKDEIPYVTLPGVIVKNYHMRNLGLARKINNASR